MGLIYFRKWTAAVLATCLTMPALGQSFPTKPVRIILTTGPGSAADTVPRLLAERMAADLGQPVVVENRPGGASMVAINEVLNSPADGHTTLAAGSSEWAINPAMQKLPYDFVRDFTPLGQIFTGSIPLVVPSSLGVNNMQELIAYMKARPGQINYPSFAVGSLFHLQGEVLGRSLGLQLVHVPYKSGAEMVESVLRGDSQFAIAGYLSVISHVKAGKLKILAVNTTQRSKVLPDVPTIAETTGLKDFDFPPTYGLVVRSGTPKPVVERLATVLAKAVSQPDLVSKMLQTAAVEMVPSTPEQLAEMIRADITKYANAVKLSGAKI